MPCRLFKPHQSMAPVRDLGRLIFYFGFVFLFSKATLVFASLWSSLWLGEGVVRFNTHRQGCMHSGLRHLCYLISSNQRVISRHLDCVHSGTTGLYGSKQGAHFNLEKGWSALRRAVRSDWERIETRCISGPPAEFLCTFSDILEIQRPLSSTETNIKH